MFMFEIGDRVYTYVNVFSDRSEPVPGTITRVGKTVSVRWDNGGESKRFNPLGLERVCWDENDA